MASRPVTEEDIAAIKRLHAQGKSRNEIARELGRSGRTISRYAEGLSFERGAQTTAATAAKVADAKSRRAELQLKLLEDAERLRLQLFEPAIAFNFGGKENSYNERTIDEPTFADKRNIIQAVGVAVSTSIKIDEHDRAGDNLAGVDAWLVAHLGSGE